MALVAAPVLLSAGLFIGDVNEVGQLERAAPKIERASSLSPEAHETVKWLLERQKSLDGSRTLSGETRRKAAIERVTNAMKAKEVAAADHATSETRDN